MVYHIFSQISRGIFQSPERRERLSAVFKKPLSRVCREAAGPTKGLFFVSTKDKIRGKRHDCASSLDQNGDLESQIEEDHFGIDVLRNM